MTKDEAIKITATMLINIYSHSGTIVQIINVKRNALNGGKESVAWLYHNLEELEQFICELKQAMKGEQDE